MKKILYLLIFIYTLSNKTNAQSNLFFEHANFETWDSSQGFLNPANWFSLNDLTTIGLPATLERTTDAHSGNFAVKLESKDYQGGSLSGVITTGPLLDPNGDPNFNTIKVPYTYRPTRFQFYYHADPEDGDSCLIAFVLTRRNLALQKIDTVGFVYKGFGDSTGTYTLADLEVIYTSPLSPDSAYIIASSSADGFNPTAGSKFFLDDINIVGGSNGLQNMLSSRSSVEVYPNPTNKNVVIKTSQKGMHISLLSVEGKLLSQINSESTETSIDISNWGEGIYFVEIKTEAGEIFREKLIVQ